MACRGMASLNGRPDQLPVTRTRVLCVMVPALLLIGSCSAESDDDVGADPTATAASSGRTSPPGSASGAAGSVPGGSSVEVAPDSSSAGTAPVEEITLSELRSVEPGRLKHALDGVHPELAYDENGIVVIDPAPWPDLDQAVPLRHPTVVARGANGLFTEQMLEGADPDRAARHLAQARWLRNSVRWEGGVANWVLPMALPGYSIDAGWVSAMTNGFGLAVMLQAARVGPPGEAQGFLDVANGVIRAFATDVEDGGVARGVDGDACFEEVAIANRPLCILNGHVFGLGGLDVAAAAGSGLADDLLASGIDYVRHRLDSYDAGFASRYSPEGTYADAGGYNLLHVHQLLWLHRVDGDDLFLTTAARWLNFEHDPTITVVDTEAVEPVEHGPERLSDEETWFGYWSAASDPVELSFRFETDREVCGISIFAVAGERLPFTSATVDVDGVSFRLDTDVPTETNVNAAGSTLAAAFPLGRCVTGRTVVVRLSGSTEPVIALREIDLHLDRRAEAEELELDLARSFDLGRV